MTADITLRGPDEVIAVLPYQLGYHPRNSVVAVALRGRSMGMVARTDLPPEEHAAEAATTIVGPLLREEAASVILVAWEDAPDSSTPVLLALVEQLEAAGVEVVDVAVVRDGRRYSPICAEHCCPADGEPLRDPSTVPAVAEMVAMGRAPLPSREEVDILVEPDPHRAQAVERAVAFRATRRPGRRRWARAWGRLLDPGAGPPDDHVVADAVLALGDIGWRDGLVAWLSPGVLPLTEVDPAVLALLRAGVPRPTPPRRGASVAVAAHDPAVRTVLLELVRAVPDTCVAEASAACTVAAHVAWAQGDGALARAAVERALRLAPDYTLAVLLARLVDVGVRFPRGRGRPHGPAGLRSVG